MPRSGYLPWNNVLTAIQAKVAWVFILSILADDGGLAAAQTAEDVNKTLEAMDRLWFGNSSTAKVSMTVKTAHYERTLKLHYWVNGKEQTLVRIAAPPKEEGTATLKLGRDIFNYLPRIGRTIKVSAALRQSAWMGSHFTNDDLMKSSHFSLDYVAKLKSSTGTGADTLWTVELVPKPDAAISWSRVEVVLLRDKSTPKQQDFFDEKGQLSRTIVFLEPRDLGGRVVPSLVRVTPTTSRGEFTELRYDSIERDVKFGEGFFSLAKLGNQ